MNDSNAEEDFCRGISIILPALNEEDNIEPLVNEIIDYFKVKQIKYEVIIVDDGSDDKTAVIADKLSEAYNNIVVIHHSRNKGYGRSLRDGFQAGSYEYLFYTDADRQFKISSLDKFFPFMNEKEVAMVVGYRIDRQDIFLRKFLAWCYNRLVSAVFNLDYEDIDCAFKLFKKEAYESLDLKSDDFLIDAEILAKAGLKKLRVVQVGVKHYPRTRGESTVSYKHIFITLKRMFSLYGEIRNLPERSEEDSRRFDGKMNRPNSNK